MKKPNWTEEEMDFEATAREILADPVARQAFERNQLRRAKEAYALLCTCCGLERDSEGNCPSYCVELEEPKMEICVKCGSTPSSRQQIELIWIEKLNRILKEET